MTMKKNITENKNKYQQHYTISTSHNHYDIK